MRKQDACFNERFLKPLKRKRDSFTSSRLSNNVLESSQSRVYMIPIDNDYAIKEKEEDFDPQYTRFLKKLRVYGKSYALEVSQTKGVPVYLKYHMEGELGDVDNRPSTRREMSNCREEEKMEERKETKNKVGRHRKLRSLPRTDQRDLVNDGESRPSTRRNFKKGEKTEETNAAKNKVGHPRKLGRLPRTDQRDLVDDEDSKLPTGQKSNGKKEDKLQASKETKNKDCRPPIRGKRSHGNTGEKVQARIATKLDMGNPRTLRSRSLLRNESRDPVECDADDLGVDGAYQLFLNGISKHENVWVWKCPSSRQVVYEEDAFGCLSDSEIEIWDIVPNGSDGNPTPFVSEQGCPASSLGVRGHCSAGTRNSEFRKKVMDILRRPYNHDELAQLLRDIEAEKPVGRIKDLRSRPISFSVGATKSYLNHHIGSITGGDRPANWLAGVVKTVNIC